MRRNASTLAIATSLALLGAAGAHAQGSTTPAPDPAATTAPAAPSPAATAKLARSDVSFMKDAARAGQAEIESSKLALQKASDPQVKAFAQQMVDDHTKAASELKALAQSKGVELPDDPSLMQRGKIKMLSGADGTNFDKRYADGAGLKAHEDTVKLFQKAASSAKDPDVKAFAASTLPTLQKHLEMARQLHASVGAKKVAG